MRHTILLELAGKESHLLKKIVYRNPFRIKLDGINISGIVPKEQTNHQKIRPYGRK